MKTAILIIIFNALLITGLSFPQIKSLSEAELKNELTRALIERLGYKQQAEISDSLISELYKSQQREWIKDLELGACAEEKFVLSQQLLNFECPESSWWDNFAFGAIFTVSVIALAFLVGVLL